MRQDASNLLQYESTPADVSNIFSLSWSGAYANSIPAMRLQNNLHLGEYSSLTTTLL
ncbi:hypothetical protein BRADI_1g69821v3 [Brachypodium distachyon]|uniref:Uncharacterized protein n=1 Tax=Brachypodium distachyon TaxID=15368 RepID=A0A2K2DUB0_BRADI|nr:hypothetical protein BRADI_1g69821v3 [Brachypodium distachyon]